ncbi:M23 family metallopeptidase [Undibacterium sp. CY18W]|uniref:M23 family metallopeptidase n=1 Tax=Undibacterium hunanense TaxID=2762292 RepID=A0ABR6ZNY7_9BURK|nr:M23 family metallopeptidase [Undibacterium hunanense]
MRPSDKLLRLASGSRLLFGTTRASRIVSVSALFFAVCAFGAVGVAPLAPDASDLPVKRITEELSLPKLEDQVAALEASEQQFTREATFKSSEPLSTFLQRIGVDDDEASQFIKSDSIARSMLQFRADKTVAVKTDDEGELLWLQTTVSDGPDKPVRNIVIKRDTGGKLVSSDISASLERRVEMATAYIRTAFYPAADDALIPYNVTEQVKSMFETNVDYQRLQKGDYFNIVYESFWQNGERVRTGRVLAGEFSNSGKLYQAAWFEETGGKGGYYTFDGKSLKKAFLKSPIEFTRVSSGFSMRVHPISGQWKAHKGVDFAAATGTPIRASADGVVDSAAPSNGYGNLVVLKHWNNYSTAYAHMSRFAAGIHKGSKVSQGDVIGYVGTTGWSTGPHLHYEFRVNNEARDPMSINMTEAAPLAANEMNRFKGFAGDMNHRFNLLHPERMAETMKLALR